MSGEVTESSAHEDLVTRANGAAAADDSSVTSGDVVERIEQTVVVAGPRWACGGE
ncbi:hypothetical protein [Nocardia terpenica]|nr:hypothetical protein [Nocardia terpenica]